MSGLRNYDDDCQAWVHGAVYPGVYDVFKQFKAAPLPRVEEPAEFEDQEWRILNAVKRYYFDIYSARALEEIRHWEEPYIEARKGRTVKCKSLSEYCFKLEMTRHQKDEKIEKRSCMGS